MHNQGIIHRDIKPANLLWSADRRVVKIADFGISHFSYAQFLAAKGKAAGSDQDHEEHDKILLDESDLTRFAGTPTFLAPEILADGTDLSNSSTASNLQTVESQNTEYKRPPITKAIDIWAFGVTLYALLFGKLPFVADHEFGIYACIKTQDWDVPELMGQDRIPVGGRHQKKPKKGQETEGYLVVDLLQGLLEKDPSKRLTLQEVKVSLVSPLVCPLSDRGTPTPSVIHGSHETCQTLISGYGQRTSPARRTPWHRQKTRRAQLCQQSSSATSSATVSPRASPLAFPPSSATFVPSVPFAPPLAALHKLFPMKKRGIDA